MSTWITGKFDIDWWIELASEQPFKFTQQRNQWLETTIHEAAPWQKSRLEGIKWELNMDLEIARNKYRPCKYIAQRLVEHLTNIKEILSGKPPVLLYKKPADIVDFASYYSTHSK